MFGAQGVQIALWAGLVTVLGLAAVVRLSGIGWDGYAGLHPDERHVLFVTQRALGALADPAFAGLSPSAWWFDPESPLNPHRGEASYVYGEAPLFVGVLLAHLSGVTDWFAVMPMMRVVSSLLDATAVLWVFLAARMVAPGGAALAAAVVYAAMPTALQLANFHTVDVWLGASTAAMLVPLMALATGRGRPVMMGALAGVALGLAMASKITGVLMFAPAAVALGLAWRAGLSRRRVGMVAAALVLVAFAVFRLANPFAFAGPGVFGLMPSAEFIADFRGLAEVTASAGFPPNWQWIAGYGPLRLARDFALFGCGPVALFVLTGLLGRRQGAALWVPAAVVLSYVTLTALSSVAALRYGAPALPALAVLLAPAFARIGTPLTLTATALAVFWGAGAARLHDGAHPRVLASHWLWALPRGTIVTNETAWDEGLPTIIALRDGEPFRWPGHDNWFTLQSLDITDPDSPEKAARIAALLARTDVLVLSSDRQSAVMPRLPDRFPMTTEHYRALLSGEACFAPVLVLDRGYPLPLFPFDDSWAQEPWRVYDHPVVRIFLRAPCFSEAAYRDRLLAALAD